MRRCAVLILALAACTQNKETSRRTTTDVPTETVATTADQTDAGSTNSDKPIYLPSQDKAKNGYYPMKGTRPNEVCMEKGFNWLYQGYLQPECGTCHYVANRFNVTAFGQPDATAALAVMRTSVDPENLLAAVITNTFCKNCTIKKEDPLYVDLEYFTRHMNGCDLP